MERNVSELPKPPHPHAPPAPEKPQHAQPPTVFVYEKPGWEYKVVGKDAADEPSLAQDELNALGKEGWELVGIVPRAGTLLFYLKRARS